MIIPHSARSFLHRWGDVFHEEGKGDARESLPSHEAVPFGSCSSRSGSGLCMYRVRYVRIIYRPFPSVCVHASRSRRRKPVALALRGLSRARVPPSQLGWVRASPTRAKGLTPLVTWILWLAVGLATRRICAGCARRPWSRLCMLLVATP